MPVTQILTVGDALRALRELVPGASAIIASHVANQALDADPDELEEAVAPYWLFTEIREHVFENAPGMTLRIAGLFAFMEMALVSHAQSVRDGSAIRIAHKLYRYENAIKASGVIPGPRLAAAMG